MKIHHVHSQKRPKNSRKGDFLMNVYYFFSLYRYVIVTLLVLVVIFFTTLTVVDLLKPAMLKDLDEKATLELFNQLQTANRDQDAIVLMEYKGGFLNDSHDEIEYKCKLSESYIKVGDYSKAEKLLLDVWDNVPKHLESLSEKKGYKLIADFTRFSVARIIYQMYEKMGDQRHQEQFFRIYKHYYDLLLAKDSDSFQNKFEDKSLSNVMKVITDAGTLVKYDSLVVESFTDRKCAMRSMDEYVSDISSDQKIGAGFKIRCLNKLIEWDFSEGYLGEAYANIKKAVNLVPEIKTIFEYTYLGKLSDYCYKIHDLELSRDISSRYQKYLDKCLSKSDYEYLMNYERLFRYLDAEGKYNELSKILQRYCYGMKRQIAMNIPSMSEEQREYFAKLFDNAYETSLRLLAQHPSQDLANLCFDNVLFRNGLLLRSNLSIRRSIEKMGDPSAIDKFEELQECRREQIFQSVSRKKLFNASIKLEQRIEELEKELAIMCTDFKTKNDLEEVGHASIQHILKNGEAVVQLLESEDHLMALVLKDKGDVAYIDLGDSDVLNELLKRPVYEVYHDAHLTEILVSKVLELTESCHTIYYIPSGVFNQIALSTLYIGEDRYLSDIKDVRLVSNPFDFTGSESNCSLETEGQISLWGGIEYGRGPQPTSQNRTKRIAIKRGDSLENLRYTYYEVSAIYDMMRANRYKCTMYSDSSATERTFKERSGKGDVMLHVSTHGYFADASDDDASMLNSGLFFAGANKYWCETTMELDDNEDDGILRAAEIATLDLTGCALVVLSACETGLGFSKSSEGVYGLQRAFKLAGADWILMSLWEVDDRATSMLMTEFYRNLLMGENPETALKVSKKKVRDLFPSPEDWGAFVLLH